MRETTSYALIARIAKFYDAFLRLTGYEKEVNFFIDQVPLKKDAPLKVLDTACGTGPYSLAILKKYPNAHITSFDLNAKLVERLSDKLKKMGLDHRARIFAGNVTGPLKEISDEKFDLVIVAGILEHVPLEETATFLSGFVAPGGYVLSSPTRLNTLGKFIDWLYGCWPNTRERNIAAFTQNGFVLQKLLVPRSFKELHIFQKQNKTMGT